MSIHSFELQKSVFSALNGGSITDAGGSAITGVFDDVPTDTAYPYIRIGEETISILEEKIPNLDLYVEALNNTYGVEIESTIAHHRDMKHLRQKDVKDEKISQQAKLNAIMTYADTVSAIGGMMQDVSEKNEKLAIAGVIIEKSAAIAGIIANTKAANAENRRVEAHIKTIKNVKVLR